MYTAGRMRPSAPTRHDPMTGTLDRIIGLNPNTVGSSTPGTVRAARNIRYYGGKAIGMGRAAYKVGAPVASVASVAAKYGYKAGYPAANALTKMSTGASIPQIGAAAGLGLLAWGALRDDPLEDMRSIGAAGSSMMDAMQQQAEMAQMQKYKHTSFQQSTQGLVFGLNSRRTR